MNQLPKHYYHPSSYWAQMLTLRCNAGCGFCILNNRGRAGTPDELTSAEIIDFWNTVPHEIGKALSLIGGEPTLHKGFIEIVNGLKGYTITITTNCKSPFYTPDFTSKFRLHPTSTLRINTSFHPHFIDADDYAHVVNAYKDAGIKVDQVNYVNYPDVDQFQENIDRLKEQMSIYPAPYMGFYDPENHFKAPFGHEANQPSESNEKWQNAKGLVGYRSVDDLNHMTAAVSKSEVTCYVPAFMLMISPDGYLYHCHYKLYHGIDPVSHISNFKPTTQDDFSCKHYGFCMPCDVSKMGGIKFDSTPLALNKTIDFDEPLSREVQKVVDDIDSCRYSGYDEGPYPDEIWSLERNVEYAHTILYSGHRHRGGVFLFGMVDYAFIKYLKSQRYKVDVSICSENTKTSNPYDLLIAMRIKGDELDRLVKIPIADGGILVLSMETDGANFVQHLNDLCEFRGFEIMNETNMQIADVDGIHIGVLRKKPKLIQLNVPSKTKVIHKW